MLEFMLLAASILGNRWILILWDGQVPGQPSISNQAGHVRVVHKCCNAANLCLKMYVTEERPLALHLLVRLLFAIGITMPASSRTLTHVDNSSFDRVSEVAKWIAPIAHSDFGNGKKLGILARQMPCCGESIGTHACAELRNRRPFTFKTRCKTDADFGFLQCCWTCMTDVATLGQDLFAEGEKSKHCYDRQNHKFCAHFVHQGGMWSPNSMKQVGCNGEGASLAFRICRRSCGFCNLELYDGEEAKSFSSKCARPPTTPTGRVVSGNMRGKVKSKGKSGGKSVNISSVIPLPTPVPYSPSPTTLKSSPAIPDEMLPTPAPYPVTRSPFEPIHPPPFIRPIDPLAPSPPPSSPLSPFPYPSPSQCVWPSIPQPQPQQSRWQPTVSYVVDPWGRPLTPCTLTWRPNPLMPCLPLQVQCLH